MPWDYTVIRLHKMGTEKGAERTLSSDSLSFAGLRGSSFHRASSLWMNQISSDSTPNQ